MKRIFAVVMTAVLATSFLVACGDEEACAAGPSVPRPPAPRPAAPRVATPPKFNTAPKNQRPQTYKTVYRDGHPVYVPIIVNEDDDCD